MDFKTWVKSVQTAGYNGACTVNIYHLIINKFIDKVNFYDYWPLQIFVPSIGPSCPCFALMLFIAEKRC